jgi:GDP-D-mannose 3',5'-epimerase
MDAQSKILVTGAGGFIGGHLVARLLDMGVPSVRCVDIKPQSMWHQLHESCENVELDLRESDACEQSCEGIEIIFNLAADMGGIGFIEANKSDCMRNVLINTNLLQAALEGGAERYFFASSACVYPDYRQREEQAGGLRESDAYPAMPEDGYGWEKLFSERLCRHYFEDHGLETRVGRLHNVYGPMGAWNDGREKAPAALCRKIAEAELGGGDAIEVWGDGNQVRSFLNIEDCVDAILWLTASDCAEPLNIGSDERITVRELVSVIEDIAEHPVKIDYQADAAIGVNARCSDNSRIESVLGWKPAVPLWTGLHQTYSWIREQIANPELGRGGLQEARDAGPIELRVVSKDDVALAG